MAADCGDGAAGSGPLVQIYHLTAAGAAAGAHPLRLHRAGWRVPGTIEALDADYTRTAVLKGLPQRDVPVRHVLRNALLPTITVIGRKPAT